MDTIEIAFPSLSNGPNGVGYLLEDGDIPVSETSLSIMTEGCNNIPVPLTFI
jgi:hypothetical protein